MSDDLDSLELDLLAFVGDLVLTDDEPFDADTDLLLDGLVDSMGVVQLVHWLEARLGTEIEPADVVIDNFRSVRAMVAFARRRASTGS
ncbi:MAG: acyl carrier protein [Acidimicrobiales bacterium]|jgi:acyl carrier protein|nr:acyl carrier protein [Acidimicrobiales bacterium]